MISKNLASLLQRANGGQFPWMGTVLGCALGGLVPFLAWLIGGVVSCLDGGKGDSPARFSRFLANPAEIWLGESTPLMQVVGLVSLSACAIILGAIALYLFYRVLQRTAVQFEAVMMERLRQHARSLARSRTLAAQRQALVDCIDYHLPRVRACLARWWRTYPRHLLQLVACVVLALLVEPTLGVLAIVAAGLGWLVYRYLDRGKRMLLPVVRERATLIRGELADLSLHGPLLESVHQESEVTKRYQAQLKRYERDAFQSLTSSAWKEPTILLVGGLMGVLFAFVVSVQILKEESSFGLAGLACFAICGIGASVSFARLQRAKRDLRTIDTAVEELERFLSLPIDELPVDDLPELNAVQDSIELEHVTLQDSRARKLLQDVSVAFTPGKLIGVVASQPLQASTLVELLMGFGRPVSGRMIVDGRDITDIHPESLVGCAQWVSKDGALLAGSVRENLLGSKAWEEEELKEKIVAAGLQEAVQRLPEGLATLISPNDDRLGSDVSFRLGIARAALSGRSILAIEEPVVGNVGAKVERQTLAGTKSVVDPGKITVILPQRLHTLRECDQVIVLHEHQISDVGSHAELLERSELYRHLNYQRFNPFRRS